MKSLAVPAALFLFASAPFLCAEEAKERTLSVSGTATVKGEVDIVTWNFTLRGEGDTIEAAAAVLEEAAVSLKKRLEENEIPAGALRFSRIRSGRLYETVDREQIFKGYYAERSARIRVENVDVSQQAESALLADDAIQVGGVDLESSRYEELKKQALANAVAVGKEKAERIAKQLGVELGQVLEVSEGSGAMPFQVTENRVTMSTFEGVSGVEFEQVELTAHVSLRFALR